jgi:hypothetical protein
MSNTRAEVVADRFLVHHDARAIDLATGEDVSLIISNAGEPADQSRWARRCDRFFKRRHRALAQLVDYGGLGASRRSKRGAAVLRARVRHVMQRTRLPLPAHFSVRAASPGQVRRVSFASTGAARSCCRMPHAGTNWRVRPTCLQKPASTCAVFT